MQMQVLLVKKVVGNARIEQLCSCADMLRLLKRILEQWGKEERKEKEDD